MIFTFRANKKQVEDAALKSREEGREEGIEEGIEIGREEGRAEGREEGQSTVNALWHEWLDQIKDLPPENWPPPPGAGNGDTDNSNGKRTPSS